MWIMVCDQWYDIISIWFLFIVVVTVRQHTLTELLLALKSLELRLTGTCALLNLHQYMTSNIINSRGDQCTCILHAWRAVLPGVGCVYVMHWVCIDIRGLCEDRWRGNRQTIVSAQLLLLTRHWLQQYRENVTNAATKLVMTQSTPHARIYTKSSIYYPGFDLPF